MFIKFAFLLVLTGLSFSSFGDDCLPENIHDPQAIAHYVTCKCDSDNDDKKLSTDVGDSGYSAKSRCQAEARATIQAVIQQAGDAARGKAEQAEQATKAKREALKDLEEKCRQANKDVEEELKDAQGEAKEWEEKFHDAGQDITKLEEKHSEQQVEIRENLDKLKQESNRNVQELKDDMGKEMKNIDAQVAQVSAKIADLNRQLEKVEDLRLTAYYARRKQQNEFYSQCFGQALTQAEAERAKFYKKKTHRRARRQNMGQLMTGGKQQNKAVFSGQFNSYLHLCLNNQSALLQKQNMKNEYQLTVEKLAREEERTQAQIEELKQQIQKLNTQDKAEVVARFKEKMEKALQAFNQNHELLTTNYQTSSQNTIKQIEEIKKQQANHLMRRSQAVPKEGRSTMISQQCQGQDVFNMFANSSTGERGLFNSTPSSIPDTGSVR